MEIKVDKIRLPEFQIREEIDSEHVEEIKESFEKDGQWNPIIVRPIDDEEYDYEVISGAHRLSAARDLGWSEIEATAKDLGATEARGLAIKTNRMQKEMQDEEIGELCKELYTEYNLTREEIGEITGLSPSNVRNKLTLVMDLADPVYEKIKSGELPERMGLVIAGIDDDDDQVEFMRRIQKNDWSRNEAFEQRRRFLNDTVVSVGYSGKDYDELVEELQEKDVDILVDVRKSGESMYKPEFNTDVLRSQFENVDGIEYVHKPEFGVPQMIVSPYKEQAIGHQCFEDWYQWHIHNGEDKFEEFADFLKESGKPALMCMEKYPKPEGDQDHYCHRHHLAEELMEKGYFRYREDIGPVNEQLV